MRPYLRTIPIVAFAFALLLAQSAGGHLLVRCIDGSPCPLTNEPPKPCCKKPCHEPLPPTCIVSITPAVELAKPRPAEAPATPFTTLLLPDTLATADLFARRVVLVRTDTDDAAPEPPPRAAIHGPRAPPMHRSA